MTLFPIFEVIEEKTVHPPVRPATEFSGVVCAVPLAVSLETLGRETLT
jgi:hypothetical protein